MWPLKFKCKIIQIKFFEVTTHISSCSIPTCSDIGQHKYIAFSLSQKVLLDSANGQIEKGWNDFLKRVLNENSHSYSKTFPL